MMINCYVYVLCTFAVVDDVSWWQDRTSGGDFSPATSSSQLRHASQLPKTLSEPAIGALDDSESLPDTSQVKGSSCDLNLPGQRLLWVATPKPHNSDKVIACCGGAVKVIGPFHKR